MATENVIEAFVSYSRDSKEHQEWVARLADDLDRQVDIHVVLDAYEVYGGKDLLHFMEQCRSCERAIIVITSNYVRKANDREGGVGYETSMGAADLFRNQLSDKFIPVLREGSELPSFISSKTYIDFRDDNRYADSLQELLRAVRREPSRVRPPKDGALPSASAEQQEPRGRYDPETATQLRGILGIIEVPTRALEAFHEDVQALFRDGVWAFNINVGPRQQMTDAEQRFRDKVRAAVDRMASVEKFLQLQIKKSNEQGASLIQLAGNPLIRVRYALAEAISASNAVTALIAKVKRGISIDDLRSLPEYRAAADAATKLSEILMEDLNRSGGDSLGFFAGLPR